MKILWVEDDAVIAGAVADFLAGKGCAVTHCPTLAAAQQAMQAAAPELVLLDWNLPDGAGADFCRALRSRFPALPLLLLTVRSDTADVLAGFACGADDYVTKPFELEILYSRIEALWRRCGHRDNAGSLLQCGGIALDEARQLVTLRGREVRLGYLEYRLLALLMQNKGRTLTRQQLLSALWDQNGRFVNDNTLTVTMKRLREKLGQPACLKTIRSFGYRLEEDTP